MTDFEMMMGGQLLFDAAVAVYVVATVWRTPKFLRGVDPLAVPAFLNRKRRVFGIKFGAAAKAWKEATE